MDQSQGGNPFGRLIEFARPHKTGYIVSVVLAVLGVAFGIVPYFATARMTIELLSGNNPEMTSNLPSMANGRPDLRLDENERNNGRTRLKIFGDYDDERYTKISAIMMSAAALISVLPVGCLFYMNGSLSAATFITVTVLSLGIAGPLVAAMFFTDDIAKIGTVMGEIDGILNQPELVRPEEKMRFAKP